MAQSSGPIAQGTTSERQFTDVMWRDRFGDEPGVLGDMDGSAYALALPVGSDIVSVGSETQVSVATVAGFVHRIPMGSPEPITVPAASGSTRTDIIGLRYDPTYTGLPGPVRLYRTAGTSADIPTYDSSPPGVEDLPLWAITRAVGQNLFQATVQRLFPRIAPSMEMPVGVDLPVNSPLGTTVCQGEFIFQRRIVGTEPAWVGRTHEEHGYVALDGTFLPDGARRVHVRRSVPVQVSNSSGGFSVPYGVTFTKLMSVGLSAGDNEGGLAFVTPIVANHTVTTANGVARRADSSAVPDGTTIRVEVDAVGYIF